MRIALVVPEFPPHHLGGGGVVFQALFEEYSRRHQVRVFSGHDPVRSWLSPRVIEADQPDVWRYPLAPLLPSCHYLRTVVPPGPVAAVALGRDLRQWAPEAAHLHGYGYALVDLAAAFLRLARVPYVFTNHGFPLSPASQGGPIRAAYRLYRVVGADRTAHGAAAVTGVSASAVPSREGGRLAGRVQVVPNGLTRLPTSTETGRRRLRSKLQLNDAIPVVAAAGRLSVSKGFDVLINAISRSPGPITCVIAGQDGGAKDQLQLLAHHVMPPARVVLAGPMQRQELADLFALASVVAVPSRDEPFGLVALEAVAAGKRVVATRTGGLADFLAPPIATLVPPEDHAELARALATAIALGELSPEETASSNQLVERYAWPQVSLRYEELLARAARSRPRGPVRKLHVTKVGP